MKRTDTANVTPDGSADPASRPPCSVVPLNAELRRPPEEIRPHGQTGIGFMQPVPDEKAVMLGKLERMAKASFEEKNDGKRELLRWALEDRRQKEWARIEEEARVPALNRPAPTAPAAAKPASAPKRPSGNGKRQESLPFDARTPAAGRAANDPENEPLEVAPQARLSLRDEILAMELPLFALSKIPEVWTEPRTYTRKNGRGTVTVACSSHGAATIHDYDLLIYCVSYIADMLKRRQRPSRSLAIDVADLLRKTGRGHGRKDYESIPGMLDRLCGTRLKTDIPTNGVLQLDGFGLIESYRIVLQKERVGTRKNRKTGKEEPCVFVRVLKFIVTLSEWFYNSARHEGHILDVDPAYFSLDSGIERRLYQIARRHCGTDKALWKIDIELLAKKTGTKRELFKFREDIRHAIRDDRLPGYHIALDSQAKPNMVVFYPKVDEKDEKAKAEFNKSLSAKLTELSRQGPDGFNAFEWFHKGLERAGSDAIQAKANSAERKQRKRQRAADREAKRLSVDLPAEAGEREADDA